MTLPIRKRTRLKNYDYSTPGKYFITVCTKDKKCLLGKIVGDGDFDVPRMKLSEYGQIVDKYINFMNNKYFYISVDKYVIMPNHIHLILNILRFKNGSSETAEPYNNEISKFMSVLKRYCNLEYGENIWQRSFNDHIIRGEKDFLKIWEYINTNVFKWDTDCFYIE